MLKIVVDAMGADNGVEPIICGVKDSLSSRLLQNRPFKVILVGDEAKIKPKLEGLDSKLLSQIDLLHTDEFISMNDQASLANKKKETSIFKSIELLKNNEGDAVVSAGHSGATMSLATLQVGRIKGVLRPAICTAMPTSGDTPSVILDVGANTDCKPEYLAGFAIMGYVYSKNIIGVEDPEVGLLSNGEEDTKGNELTKEAFKILKNYPFFKGNVEGADIFNSSVDVIVCDGFMGNLVLKASEGVASAISGIIKKEAKRNLVRSLGAGLMKGAFSALKKKVDYTEYGGAPLLGIKKPVIVSHGKSNQRAIECAIYQAIQSCEVDVCAKIEQAFASFHLENSLN